MIRLGCAALVSGVIGRAVVGSFGGPKLMHTICAVGSGASTMCGMHATYALYIMCSGNPAVVTDKFRCMRVSCAMLHAPSRCGCMFVS